MILALAALILAQTAEPMPTPGVALVIAATAHQDDPQPIPCGGCGDSYFRTRFDHVQLIAGERLPPNFDARLRLHTPLMSRTTLALIVQRERDGSLLVLRRAGFNRRSGLACFNEPDEANLNWRPRGPRIRAIGNSLCVSDPTQIDPRAPRN